MSRFPLSLRLFVDPQALRPVDGRISLTGQDAVRAYLSGARRGLEIVLLDGSGWETSIVLDHAERDHCTGRILERRVSAEPRIKISLYHALGDSTDVDRLVRAATAVGAVAIISLITDRSLVPMAGAGRHEDPEDLYASAARDAAERSARGRIPRLGGPILFDHALDGATRSGAALIAFGRTGARNIEGGGESAVSIAAAQGAEGTVRPGERIVRSSTVEAALAGRAFSVALFCPPEGGFTTEEIDRADARGAAIVPPPELTASTVPTSADLGSSTLWATLAALDAVLSAAESTGADPIKP